MSFGLAFIGSLIKLIFDEFWELYYVEKVISLIVVGISKFRWHDFGFPNVVGSMSWDGNGQLCSQGCDKLWWVECGPVHHEIFI